MSEMTNAQSSDQSKLESFSYDDVIVKKFIYATIFWGFAALLVGVYIAFELAAWQLNFSQPWLTFGRLRPLHTNAAIFAFVGNAIFAGVYYSTQRLCKARLYNSFMGNIHFWLWQLIIAIGGVTLLMGYTRSREYAELEWPFDIAIAIAWVLFSVNTIGTVVKRREKHIYVAIWFYIATLVTVALLHIVNAVVIPVGWLESYPVYTGVQDAMVQWWYGHNAVAFFLTTPFLGLMYYFIPKAANRPVYSYRLSIIHFWSLIFIYIWAGPHHLLYSSIPEWAQTLGMVFSIALWAPSWGGMINGLMTLRGAWDRVRKDPVLKFLATSVTFYGMATFEGPLLSIKSVNYLAHFTDWVVGHVHSGTIGWNYMMICGILYYLVPKLWKTELYSVRLANIHFWTATVGLLLYIISMWTAGITQGLMWRAMDDTGALIYPNFIETLLRIVPMYWVRGFGGVLVLLGFMILIYNIYKTIQSAPEEEKQVFKAIPLSQQEHDDHESGHRKLEGMPIVFTILSLMAVSVGSIALIVPTLITDKYVKSDVIDPYTPLQLAGRDIYISEGCYVCHSQMVRPEPAEVIRYGDYSRAEESIYDRPFQWGSRRIGPDLARVGGKYNHMWHYRHMEDPRSVVPQSLMPAYPWLITDDTNYSSLRRKLQVLQKLGHPYTNEEVENAQELAIAEAQKITEELNRSGISMDVRDKQIVALIAYLQRLGTDIEKIKQAEEERKNSEQASMESSREVN